MMTDYAKHIHQAKENLAEVITAQTLRWLAVQGIVLTEQGQEKLVEIFRYNVKGF